jgi:hypothetical protein
MRSQIATASGNDKNMQSQNVTGSQKKRNVSATPQRSNREQRKVKSEK